MMVGSCCFSHNLVPVNLRLVLIGFAPGGATGLIGRGCRWGLRYQLGDEPRNAEFHGRINMRKPFKNSLKTWGLH